MTLLSLRSGVFGMVLVLRHYTNQALWVSGWRRGKTRKLSYAFLCDLPYSSVREYVVEQSRPSMDHSGQRCIDLCDCADLWTRVDVNLAQGNGG